MKITKYDDDDFALRLSRDETVKLLALMVACCTHDQVTAKKREGIDERHVIFGDDERIELFRVLELAGDEDDMDYYPQAVVNDSGNKVKRTLRLSKYHAKEFLTEPESA